MWHHTGIRVVMRMIAIAGCLCVLTKGNGLAAEQVQRPLPEIAETSTLPDCLEFAEANNPGLEAARQRWKAELVKVLQARSLPDPRFTYRYFIERIETRVGPQRQSLALAQTFPWFGTLKLRGEAALELARAAGQRYEAHRLKLFQRVKEAYYEYYYLSRAIAVVGESHELLVHFEEVVRSLYRTGEAEYKDLIRAQVELGIVDDRLETLRTLREPIAASLNAVLNRPPDAPLPWPVEVSDRRLADTDEAVLARVAAQNPDLGAAAHEIDRSAHAVALARKRSYPDVTVGLTYIDTGPARMSGVRGSGDDPLVAMVSINIPLWRGKYAAAVREAKAREIAALRWRDELENNLVAKASMVLHKLRDAERKMALYRDSLIPKARQTLKVTETSYRAGNAAFTDLIDAERMMLDFELTFERAFADHLQLLAEIESLAGQDLSSTVSATPMNGEIETPAGQVWTCSMHPEVRESGPGKCAICGMSLVPLEEREGPARGNEGPPKGDGGR